MGGRVRLGELLVDAGVISRAQLEEVLELQKEDGRRLGTLLIDLGFVSETQVTQVLSQQLSVPWVSLYHIEFSRQLLNLVPREIAEEHCLVPIFVRRVRGIGETLYVAMDDPSDERARDAVAEYAGLPVRTMIAPPTDIRSAIRAYYILPSQAPPRAPEAPDLEVRTLDVSEVADVLAAEAAHEASELESELLDVPAPSTEAMAAAEPAATTEPQANLAPSDPAAPPPRAPTPAPAPPDELRLGSSRVADPEPPLIAARRPLSDTLVSFGSEVDSPVVESTPTPKPPPTPTPEQHPAAPLVITEPGLPVSLPDSEPDSSVPVPSHQVPQPKGGQQSSMITLTLLDGTQVTLPARGSKGRPVADSPEQNPPTPRHALTARDLVEALRAVAHGADASDILHDVQWEALVGALLSTLLKKHLVADWEFVEEYERFRQG